PDFVIPAGKGAGPVSHKYASIRAGAHCTVTETADGRTGTVVAGDTGGGQIVEIAADATAVANLTDSYTDVPGSLVVNKSIAGPAAGRQAAVTIAVSCNGASLVPFVIAAGTNAGTVSNAYAGIAAGSTCTATEDVDGHTDSTVVAVTGSGHSVTVPAGGTA